MEDGSGWFADPEVEGQERYFDGSEWTTETRPADSDAPLPHLPDHVPELQRAFAAATADIDEVEATLGRLFDRTEGDDGAGAKGRKGRKGREPAADAGAEPVHEAFVPSDADGSAPPASVETLLGTEPGEGAVEDQVDDDALTDLDEALASEEPEKLKRSLFRRRS